MLTGRTAIGTAAMPSGCMVRCPPVLNQNGMNLKITRILSAFLLAGSIAPAYSQDIDYAAELSRTAMAKLWKDSVHEGPHPRKWTYDQSVVLLGVEGLWYRTADARYFNYMQKSMDRFVQEDGSIDTYEKESYNIDNIACGRILLALYKVTGKEKYFKATQLLRNQLKEHPRTAEGSFWHKKDLPQPGLAGWPLYGAAFSCGMGAHL